MSTPCRKGISEDEAFTFISFCHGAGRRREGNAGCLGQAVRPFQDSLPHLLPLCVPPVLLMALEKLSGGASPLCPPSPVSERPMGQMSPIREMVSLNTSYNWTLKICLPSCSLSPPPCLTSPNFPSTRPSCTCPLSPFLLPDTPQIDSFIFLSHKRQSPASYTLLNTVGIFLCLLFFLKGGYTWWCSRTTSGSLLGVHF